VPYVFAVIPARGGSKGLPGKNLKTLGKLSLIGHAVADDQLGRTHAGEEPSLVVGGEDDILADLAVGHRHRLRRKRAL